MFVLVKSSLSTGSVELVSPHATWGGGGWRGRETTSGHSVIQNKNVFAKIFDAHIGIPPASGNHKQQLSIKRVFNLHDMLNFNHCFINNKSNLFGPFASFFKSTMSELQ